MKTNKKTIVCFLAIVMLLVVSIASASTYTVRPAMNNKEEQMSTEQINPVSGLFWGEATLYIYVEVKDYSGRYPKANLQVKATPFLFPLQSVEGITDSKGNCELHVPAPPKLLGIPIIYHVCATDTDYDCRGHGITSNLYAGEWTYVDILIVIRSLDNIKEFVEWINVPH